MKHLQESQAEQVFVRSEATEAALRAKAYLISAVSYPQDSEEHRLCHENAGYEFNSVVKLTYSREHGYLRSRLDDSQDADDLLQEVYLKAYTSLPKFLGYSLRGEEKREVQFETWLRYITRSVISRYYSTYSTKIGRLGREEDLALSLQRSENNNYFGSNPEDTVIEIIDHERRIKEVKKAIDNANLSPVQKTVLLGHYVVDLTYSQIADITKLTRGNVKKKAFDVKRRVRKKLKLPLLLDD